MAAPSAIGVIGAGQMGIGIAQAAAFSNYKVFLFDADRQKSLSQMQSLKTKLSASNANLKHAALLENIILIDSMASFSQASFVIEAVKECFETKCAVFKELSLHFSAENCIVASNTSSLSIQKLAQSYQNAQNFVGLHFMNPVNKTKLVEVIASSQTSAQTVQKCESFVAALGKISVRSADTPGFVVNRILLPFINEGIWALHDGVAAKEDIDKALVYGANVPMGPLQLADFIGLDVCLAAIRNLHSARCPVCPLLVQMVDENKLGRKSNQGFYLYDKK